MKRKMSASAVTAISLDPQEPASIQAARKDFSYFLCLKQHSYKKNTKKDSAKMAESYW